MSDHADEVAVGFIPEGEPDGAQIIALRDALVEQNAALMRRLQSYGQAPGRAFIVDISLQTLVELFLSEDEIVQWQTSTLARLNKDMAEQLRQLEGGIVVPDGMDI